MWTNKNLKTKAKFHLSGTYGTALLIVAIVPIFTLIANNIIATVGGFAINYNELTSMLKKVAENESISIDEILNFILPIIRNAMIISIVSYIFNIILFEPFVYSTNNWFVRNRETSERPPINMIFQHFTNNYLNLLKNSLWKNLWLFIWSLPIIIAGAYVIMLGYDILNNSQEFLESPMNSDLAIKLPILLIVNFIISIWSFVILNRRIAYSMSGFLLADNPNLEPSKALNLSKKMLRGNKWHFIGLYLSFFGWLLLASLLPFFNIGFILLSPYLTQTAAELYATLRSQAVARNDISMEELGFVKTETARPIWNNSVNNSPYADENNFNNYHSTPIKDGYRDGTNTNSHSIEPDNNPYYNPEQNNIGYQNNYVNNSNKNEYFENELDDIKNNNMYYEDNLNTDDKDKNLIDSEESGEESSNNDI